ncbi:MAG: Abi family protein [Oscillospiraceae bacterium]|nr:Abi family protein [Oscillospiraceae bacterium]
MNFNENYVGGKIPLYALVELFSFGTLSKFYKNMKNEDKKAVAAMYGINYIYFSSWIENIAYVRNICAHYGRLYNVKFTKSPQLYKEYINKLSFIRYSIGFKASFTKGQVTHRQL